MSGDWVKEKQMHTLFGQIELLASCSNHILHKQQATTEYLPAAPMPLRQGTGKQICLFSLLCNAGWHATTSVFFTSAWYIRHGFILTTCLLLEGWLILRSFLNDDTSLYLLVVKIRWQPNIFKSHFQGVVIQCVHRVNSLCSRKEMGERKCLQEIQFFRTTCMRLNWPGAASKYICLNQTD